MNSRCIARMLLTSIAALVCAVALPAQSQTTAPTSAYSQGSDHVLFGGHYAELTPAQRALLDDWILRYNKLAGTNRTPSDFYDAAPISTRTTFEAVTNALQTTALTNSAGESLGNALDLVQYVETVRGKVPGAQGDQQFRMYVTLQPHAVDILVQSREFTRKGDNSIFHSGYPQNFRQGGGYPSIQYSVSRDGKRADIDVDYRSSAFPIGLVNGHLSPSNSDVRARNNYSRHTRRWSGLSNWWRNFFGLPVEHNSAYVPVAEGAIPSKPSLRGKVGIQSAVDDFLKSFLIDRQPNLAAAYFSPRLYACVAESPDSGKTSQTTPVPPEIWDSMTETLLLIGSPNSLSDVVEKADLQVTGLQPVPKTDSLPYTLARVSSDFAADLDCSEGQKSAPSKKSEYYATSFRLRIRGVDAGAILLVWTREGGYWKIVAGLNGVEAARPDLMPDLRSSVPAATPIPASNELKLASKSLLATQQKFLRALFLRKQHEESFQYFAESAYAYTNLYLPEEQKPATTVHEAADALRADLKKLALESPTGRSLEQIIRPYQPSDFGLQQLSHPHESAFLMAHLPEDDALAYLCKERPQLADATLDACKLPGPFFETFLSINEPGESDAGLALIWAQVGASWKIVAFSYDQP